ncbi:hypothetical protein EGR_03770 [Echinococcus granulosus]|uniref:Uncharacterized protein n=1 Tax=Echinococcus granulosus TaxID=6210 RepID=W6V4Z0_ECHGR|nr:hypothetical protein EGR_03770 [Echinococcus granulosus]EUB61284.1 hypothetical protein EGR_03770 [Echinococcus granulosus]
MQPTVDCDLDGARCTGAPSPLFHLSLLAEDNIDVESTPPGDLYHGLVTGKKKCPVMISASLLLCSTVPAVQNSSIFASSSNSPSRLALSAPSSVGTASVLASRGPSAPHFDFAPPVTSHLDKKG